MRVSTKAGGSATSQKVGGSAHQATAGPVVAPAPSDALSVSSGAQFISDIQAQLAVLPDVRLDKVEAIRAQMDAETYHPDGEAVADGLVREHTPSRVEA
jgi:negative regulator of flagellin synthesis FlgM